MQERQLTADSLAGSPNLLSIDLVKLFAKILVVGLAAVELRLECQKVSFTSSPVGTTYLKRPTGLGSIADRLVELLKDGLVCLVELGRPADVVPSAKSRRVKGVTYQSRAPRRAVVEHAWYM